MNEELTRIQELIREHKKDIEKFDVVKIGVFGSMARGDYNKDSDVDILVTFNKVTFDNYMDLKFYLEDLFGKKVDLVIHKSIHHLLRERVLREEVAVIWRKKILLFWSIF